jgi:Leucine-rich repeat (LRR) protein
MTDTGYTVITAEDAEERFSVSTDVEYPFADFAEDQETRLYSGDLHVDGDFCSEATGDWCPYNTIVDGDLIVDGALEWYDWNRGNFLLVTGNVRAQNVFLSGCPNVVVRGDLVVAGGIQGHHGDDGGLLVVNGQTTAKVIVSTLYFCLTFGEQPNAILIGDTYRTNVPVDFTDDELAGIVLPDLLDDDDDADEHKITEALRAGQPILRPTAVPSHLAVRAELDRLLSDPERVTEIDLSDKKLRAFPDQLFSFPNLRTLSLAGNSDLTAIPARIGELTSLEELDLSKVELTELPEELGNLRNLRVLDISYNDLGALPERIGDLSNLTVLRAWNLACRIPDSLVRLSQLEELDLYGLEPPASSGDDRRRRTVEFPLVVTRLPRLRSLNLSMSRLDSLPDDLLQLATLEELSLNGALGFIRKLPDLAKLPRLRVLHLDGRAANSGPYPHPRILDDVWSISTLEELGIDRWHEETAVNPTTKERQVIRPGLGSLPDGAFAAMPGLRRLDISFNHLTTLPESFYALADLAEVDLRYNDLDPQTLDRVTTTYPRVKLDLRNGAAVADVDDPHWRQVHELVAQGGRAQDHAEKAALFEEALAACVPGSVFSEYDQLYALYGVVDCLGHLRLSATSDERAALTERLVRHAELALSLVPEPGSIWHYTELGAFQEEVTRRTGNALAWTLMEAGELDRALTVVDRALTFASGVDVDYIRDTKVRILLAAGRPDGAYLIVDQVLTRAPEFGDFADLRHAPEFLAWRRANT